MVNLRSQILSARKPTTPEGSSGAAAAGGKSGSIAPEGNSPFGIFDRKNKRKAAHVSIKLAHTWADGLLRSIAGRQERVVLAIRDAARQAEKQGLDPTRDEIYVASSIRTGWKLKPDQLSKGLRSLEADGHIRFTEIRKGRHTRFLLTRPEPGGSPFHALKHGSKVVRSGVGADAARAFTAQAEFLNTHELSNGIAQPGSPLPSAILPPNQTNP